MVPSASLHYPTISANQMRALGLPSLLASLCERPVGHGDIAMVGQERTDHDGQEAALMSFEYVDQKLIIVHPHLAPCALVTLEVTGVLEADMKAGQPVKTCIEEKENPVADGDALLQQFDISFPNRPISRSILNFLPALSTKTPPPSPPPPSETVTITVMIETHA